LIDLCSKIEEINVSLSNLKLRISSIISLDGRAIDPPNPILHNLYRVTLPNGEIWAIDTTGAQFGYPDSLCPWRDFEQHRSSKINRECELGHIRHQAYQSYRMFPVRFMVAQTVEKQDLTKALESKIPVWALECGGKLDTILRGSDAAFKQAETRLLDQFEDHLKATMVELYTPEQTTRRSKVVEGQLPMNLADPDGQKRLARVLNFALPTMYG
jgi:hypothetical protein